MREKESLLVKSDLDVFLGETRKLKHADDLALLLEPVAQPACKLTPSSSFSPPPPSLAQGSVNSPIHLGVKDIALFAVDSLAALATATTSSSGVVFLVVLVLAEIEQGSVKVGVEGHESGLWGCSKVSEGSLQGRAVALRF